MMLNDELVFAVLSKEQSHRLLLRKIVRLNFRLCCTDRSVYEPETLAVVSESEAHADSLSLASNFLSSSALFAIM
jgi:hypothetical protein